MSKASKSISTVDDSKGWVPVRRGKIYCSPRCGGKCLYSKYLEACKSAKALARKLGPQWAPRVHENVGWHWNVYLNYPATNVNGDKIGGFNTYLSVHREGLKSFSAYLNKDGNGPGGNWVGSGPTPERAILDVRDLALSELQSIEHALAVTRGCIAAAF